MTPFAALIIALVIVALLFTVVYMASRNRDRDQKKAEEDTSH